MELEASITCHRAQGHSAGLVMIAAKNCRLVSRSGQHRNNEKQHIYSCLRRFLVSFPNAIQRRTVRARNGVRALFLRLWRMECRSLKT